MIKVKHWKVFQVHFRIPDSKLSEQLMKALSMQIIHEDSGMPISNECLEKALHPHVSS
jgi:hypothetical protein